MPVTIEQKVFKLDDEQVMIELNGFEQIISKMEMPQRNKIEHAIRTRVYEYCSDRNICGAFKIDYSTIPAQGYRKLLLYACYKIFEEKEQVSIQ